MAIALTSLQNSVINRLTAFPTLSWGDSSESIQPSPLPWQRPVPLKATLPAAPPVPVRARRAASFDLHLATKYVPPMAHSAYFPIEAGAYLPPALAFGKFEPIKPIESTKPIKSIKPIEQTPPPTPPTPPTPPSGEWINPSEQRDKKLREQRARASFRAREAKRLDNEKKARRNGVSEAALAATRRANGAPTRAEAQYLLHTMH